MGSGWHFESSRHSLAARGISTSRRYHAKSFFETYFKEREAKKKVLSGMGAKRQEAMESRARAAEIEGLSEYERQQAKLGILEVQRSRRDRNREVLENAKPYLSDEELNTVKLNSEFAKAFEQYKRNREAGVERFDEMGEGLEKARADLEKYGGTAYTADELKKKKELVERYGQYSAIIGMLKPRPEDVRFKGNKLEVTIRDSSGKPMETKEVGE